MLRDVPVAAVEDAFARISGDQVDVECTVALSEDGDDRVIVARDLGERRRLDRSRAEFLSVVSHELRTPLTSINGALGLLQSGQITDKDRAARMVAIAHESSDRLVRLINDLLDIERIDAGRSPLEVQPTHLRDVVERAVNAVSEPARAGPAFVVDIDDLRMLIDADRVCQTLINLLGNAAKFSPAESTVTVTTRRTVDGDVVIRVTDQGRGIPADRLTQVFERFEQVDASDARDKGGTGLGLTIARSIVEQHGGSIGVDSDLGKGSSFWCSFPAYRVIESEDATPAQIGNDT